MILHVVIIGAILIAIMGMIMFTKMKNNDGGSTITQEESAEFNNWNGVYTKGNYTITLTRSGLSKIEVALSKYNNGIEVESKNIEMDSTSKLVYDANEQIEIEKIQSGLKFSVSGESSTLKEFDGNYNLQTFSKIGWDGIYSNQNYTIVLAEIGEKKLNVMISSKLETWDTQANDFTEEQIVYKGTLYGVSQQLQITKSEKGIQIEASSDNKDSVLNKISGIYEKL